MDDINKEDVWVTNVLGVPPPLVDILTLSEDIFPKPCNTGPSYVDV
jgi:hypothetical protein